MAENMKRKKNIREGLSYYTHICLKINKSKNFSSLCYSYRNVFRVKKIQRKGIFSHI